MHLGEVADQVRAKLVPDCQRIEQKWLDIQIQRLVIEKELGKQTQALTVRLKI
jgi:hypothetical protein